MVQVHDLIQPRPEQTLLARLPTFPWPHRNPTTDSPHGQGITKPICKKSTFNKRKSGKIDYCDPTNLNPTSTACGFFTVDTKIVRIIPRILAIRKRIGGPHPTRTRFFLGRPPYFVRNN